MTITDRRFERAAVLDITGPITGRKAAAEIDAIVRRHAWAGVDVIVANLARVPIVDCAGLGALVDAYITMQHSRGAFRLACVTRRIHDLVVITRLITVFDTFDSVEDALGGRAAAEGDTAFAPRPSMTSLEPIQRFLRRA
jgi:anti-sigma B factor antagonist